MTINYDRWLSNNPNDYPQPELIDAVSWHKSFQGDPEFQQINQLRCDGCGGIVGWHLDDEGLYFRDYLYMDGGFIPEHNGESLICESCSEEGTVYYETWIELDKKRAKRGG